MSPTHESFFLPDIEGAKVVSRVVSLAATSLPGAPAVATVVTFNTIRLLFLPLLAIF